MRFENPLLLASCGALFVAASCTLITDVDRSKIPDGLGGASNTMTSGGEGPQAGAAPTNGGTPAQGGTAMAMAGGGGSPSEAGSGGAEPAAAGIGGMPGAGAPNDTAGQAGASAGASTM